MRTSCDIRASSVCSEKHSFQNASDAFSLFSSFLGVFGVTHNVMVCTVVNTAVSQEEG